MDTTRVIADPLVRNLATVGGNLAHADPANDHPATMLAVRASVVARGRNGERVIPIDDFFVDTFTTVLGADEILTEIRIPKPAARSGGAYLKLERKVGDFAIAGVAAMIALDEKGKVAAAGIGVTNAGPTAIRSRKAEEILRGQSPDDKTIAAAAAAAASEAKPWSDLRGPAEYKVDVRKVRWPFKPHPPRAEVSGPSRSTSASTARPTTSRWRRARSLCTSSARTSE